MLSLFRYLTLFLAFVVTGAIAGGDEPPASEKLVDFKRWVIAADYAPDGKLLLTAGGESMLYRPGDVVAWNPADGARVAEFAGHPTAVWAVAI